jgi:transposase-like protein
MANNGSMGKKANPELKRRGLELIDKGNSIQIVAKRVGVSESLVRNWIRERTPPPTPTALEASQEPESTTETIQPE